MATQTTPFQQTKFRYQVGKEAGKAITAVDISKGILTIATSGFVKGDMIEIEGLGALNGLYLVASVSSDKVTLSDDYRNAQIAYMLAVVNSAKDAKPELNDFMPFFRNEREEEEEEDDGVADYLAKR
ncbi:DUF4035 domain-containing protein [Actinobacillus pleuropneumoniae]|uniref:phage tail assembly protein T n=1 Tax=Actinobacillus pleuropneumoniae TaxID=715 RepID=UPI00192C58F2|nr:DUF4035 domain-containing protein [Actinobacillus pleuropneumoniae]MBL4535028.1 DUF4035 domain-containing protein [Actinobacillus pleuropneumoniae]MCI1069469.1 DUF4035 domain-containing protein [Actinobacillus pleuropneumoniae]